MSKLNRAINEIREMSELAERNQPINQVHPLVKLIVTIIYIISVISFDKYNIFGLIPMVLYPILLCYLADIGLIHCFKKMLVVLPFICFIGILNPFFDHTKLAEVSGFTVTGGMISMLTLILKGMYTLLAASLLMATTGMERLCYALKLLHIPNLIVTQIFLVYRYLTVLLNEANAVAEAYSLRAPKEKGIHYKVWGSLFGQLLFRSIDRANKIYDSMQLRGFCGEFFYAGTKKLNKKDIIYLVLFLLIIITLRCLS
jgi:cobalt/nickel transport system permease protein